MESMPEVYYIVKKKELDKILEVLQDFNKLCGKLNKMNDDLISLLEKSVKYESFEEILKANELSTQSPSTDKD